MSFDQAAYDIRCEWGLPGIAALASGVDVLVIVDVLSFCTCVEIATTRGAVILPYSVRDDSAERLAIQEGAELARPRGTGGYSLSPAALRRGGASAHDQGADATGQDGAAAHGAGFKRGIEHAP